MYNEEQKSQLNDFLKNITAELDVPASKYEEAKNRYESVGEWLLREESTLKDYSPDIYPQGSFRLGTVVKPIDKDDEYDIDLVCELDTSKEENTQHQLKDKVGVEIKSYAKANNMNKSPENKKRCWTLDYANEFHMDILPAIPDSSYFNLLLENRQLSANWTDTAIAITDKIHKNYDRLNNDWPSSNPKGFAEWFKERMKVVFAKRKIVLAKSLKADVEDVPDYKVKTPLQRAVQLLKRHRDIYFDGKDHKPISIIITTLAGHAYNNEEDLYSALSSIVNNISNVNTFISNDRYEILNPVNPAENFADKWNEDENLPRAFQEWINSVRIDFGIFIQKNTVMELQDSLKPVFGATLIEKVGSKLQPQAVNVITEKKYPKVKIKNPDKPWSVL